jgi:predicted secreted protein
MKRETGIYLTGHFVNHIKVDGELAWFSRENNPFSGYLWRCIEDSSGTYRFLGTLELVPVTNAEGIPGLTLWKCQALKKGKGTITFQRYQRGAEKPEETITVRLEVS